MRSIVVIFLWKRSAVIVVGISVVIFLWRRSIEIFLGRNSVVIFI